MCSLVPEKCPFCSRLWHTADIPLNPMHHQQWISSSTGKVQNKSWKMYTVVDHNSPRLLKQCLCQGRLSVHVCHAGVSSNL
jgi:hypothetical protein